MRDKKELERYMAGYENDENAPPHMRGAKAREAAAQASGGKGAERQNAVAKAARGAKKKSARG
jgi:hypothetical protein